MSSVNSQVMHQGGGGGSSVCGKREHSCGRLEFSSITKQAVVHQALQAIMTASSSLALRDDPVRGLHAVRLDRIAVPIGLHGSIAVPVRQQSLGPLLLAVL